MARGELRINGIDAAAEQISRLEQYLSAPIATYVHTANKEVAVSAVDVDTDTFTSVGHGLENGSRLSPIANYDAGKIYAYDKYPGGLVRQDPAYYVVNKTADTFQLSLTNGGAAINLTENANMDLTKWHFEVPPSNIVITGLETGRKCLVKYKMRSLFGNVGYLFVNDESPASDCLFSGVTVFAAGTNIELGDVDMYGTILIDYTDYLRKTCFSQRISSSTVSTVGVSIYSNRCIVNFALREQDITSIKLNLVNIANRSVLEVYRA